MTKRTGKKRAADALEVKAVKGEDPLKTVARLGLRPGVRHAQVAGSSVCSLLGEKNAPTIMDNTEALAEILESAKTGNKEISSQLLAAQAVTLDALFTELAMRSRKNMGQYIDAAESYMRLALRAQSNSRATLEALAKLHQPREQTVKHVQVNEGGQAVVADQFHQHGGQDEKSGKQCHATGAAGVSPAMLGAGAEGGAVPFIDGNMSKESMILEGT